MNVAVQRFAGPFLAALAVLFLTLAGALTAQAADSGKKHQVIFHVTENDPVKWNQALNNVGNLQHALGKDKVEIEIVVNGPGLEMMKFDSVVGSRMDDAMKNGVSLLACGATMKAAKVTKEDLYQGVTVVPGGVIRVMNRQEAGWTYIKN
jgi:intracellular sulfur oxidation DsrE/DsrF family protein